MNAPGTGDSQHIDETPTLVKNVDPYWPEPQLIEVPRSRVPMAEELRAAGYGVPEDATGDVHHRVIVADSPTAPGEVHLVLPDPGNDPRTTNQIIADTAKKAQAEARRAKGRT